MRLVDIMLALIRYDVLGHELSSEVKEKITPDTIQPLYTLANKHDLAHLIADALEKNGLTMGDAEMAKRLIKVREIAVFRYAQIQYEQRKVIAAFEKNGVPFIPLKGAILRQYYPAPWMRTSSDIDILIHPEDIGRATEILEGECGYRSEGKLTSHDVSFHSTTGVHFELHYDLLDEEDELDSEIVSDIWSYASPSASASSHYQLSDEAFYFYHIMHMAKHFRGGGCGIRTLLDLWILNHSVEFDIEKRNSIIEKGNLSEYNSAMIKISESWFSDVELDEFTSGVEEFILSGGVYGTEEHNLAVQQVKSGGRFRYIWNRIFVSRKFLTRRYPKLKKRPYLFLFYQVKRWVSVIFNKETREKSIKEFAHTADVRSAEDKTRELLEKLNI